MKKQAQKILRRLGWFGQAASKNAEANKPLEPGVIAVQMDQEDFRKNRTRAAVMERDTPKPAPEPKQENQSGKESWAPTKLCCPRCGSDRIFETASGRKCLNQNCGAVFNLRTEIQLL